MNNSLPGALGSERCLHFEGIANSLLPGAETGDFAVILSVRRQANLLGVQSPHLVDWVRDESVRL